MRIVFAHGASYLNLPDTSIVESTIPYVSLSRVYTVREYRENGQIIEHTSRSNGTERFIDSYEVWPALD